MVPLSLRAHAGSQPHLQRMGPFVGACYCQHGRHLHKSKVWWAGPDLAPPPVPSPALHTHAQVARYHWWKSCSLVAPFLLRFCPGASSTQAGTE